MSKSVRVAALVAFAAAGILAGVSDAQAQSGPYQFNSLTPCRIFDTRETADPNTTVTAGQPLVNPGPHYFAIRGKCSVPTTAKAVTVNITITGPNVGGDLRIFPSDVGVPVVSTLNYNANEPALANGAIVPLSATTGATTKDVAIALGMAAASGGGRVHVIMDVTGYFQQ